MRQANGDDAVGPRCLGRQDAGQPGLARPHHHHRLAWARPAVEPRPLEAVADRDRHRGDMGRHAFGHAVQHAARMHVEIAAIAAPQSRPHGQAGRSIADGAGQPAVGRRAGAELARAAIIAMAAWEIFLQRDPIAFLRAPAFGRLRADRLDHADHFVAQDARAGPVGKIHRPVAAAHAGRLDPEQAGVRRDGGKRNRPERGFARADRDRGDRFSHHPRPRYEPAWRITIWASTARESPPAIRRPAAARRRTRADRGW